MDMYEERRKDLYIILKNLDFWSYVLLLCTRFLSSDIHKLSTVNI